MGVVEWIDGDEQHAGSSDEVQPSQRDKDTPLCSASNQSSSFVELWSSGAGDRDRAISKSILNISIVCEKSRQVSPYHCFLHCA